jgi:hypothetical protein
MTNDTPRHFHASVSPGAPSNGSAIRAHLVRLGIIKPWQAAEPAPFWDTSGPTLRLIGSEDTRPQPGRWAIRPEGER